MKLTCPIILGMNVPKKITFERFSKVLLNVEPAYQTRPSDPFADACGCPQEERSQSLKDRRCIIALLNRKALSRLATEIEP